jgi:pimeloyl-ACP methyl ester carboxylesterase
VTVTARTRSGLAYEAAGDGATVLLMHAGISDRRMWDPQWASLRERFHVIRYDARGFGASADPARPYTLHGDALDVLDALEIERAAVVGASMGGGAALDMAIAVPHRVSALVTVNSTPSGWHHTRDIMRAWEAVEAAFERYGADAANELEMKMWLDGPHRPPDAVDRDIRAAVGTVNRVLLERQAAFTVEPGELSPPAIERLGDLRCPSLVVTSELDQPSVLAGAFELAREAGAEYVEIPGAAHLPNLERPREFLAAILPFLESNAA